VAVTSHFYPTFLNAVGTKTVAMTADSFHAGLATGDASAWTNTQWLYQYVSSITGAYTEIATAGTYTAGYAGRVTLTTMTFAAGSANNIWKWTCTSPAPIAFGGGAASITARSMWVEDHTIGAADASCPVVVIIDFGANVTSTLGAYTYTVDATNGLAYFTMS
jgi:hypothetical protein